MCWWLYVVYVVVLCGCDCLQACTTTLNQCNVMGGGGWQACCGQWMHGCFIALKRWTLGLVPILGNRRFNGNLIIA